MSVSPSFCSCVAGVRWRLVVVILCSWTSTAFAQQKTQKREGSALLGMGATGGQHGAGVELDLTLKYRYALWEIGMEARAAGWFPTTTVTTLGVVSGVAFGDPWSLHLWGAGGVHFYGGVGGSLGPPLGNEDPGVSAALPFLGGRVLAGYAAGRGKTRFFAGVMGLFDRDLHSVTRSSSFDVGGIERVEPHEVGQWMGGALLMAGVNLGL